MIVSKAARRYAAALLQLAEETKQVDLILNDMVLIKNTVRGSKDLLLMLKSPVVSEQDKLVILEKIFTDKVQKLTINFIRIAIEKSREDIIDQVAQAYIEAYNEAKGIVDIEVFSAHELTDEHTQALRKSLENYLSKTVQLSLKQKAVLRGGLAIKIGDTVIDGTVKHKLEELEQMFLTNALN